MIYGLLRIGSFLDDTALIAVARRGARLFTAPLVDADTYLDVFGGAAGAILVLVALHAETGDPAALEGAVHCGEVLARRAIKQRNGFGWATIGDATPTGMSHGGAGIALALARLGKAVGDGRWTELALAATQGENALFDPGVGNWLDVRRDEEPYRTLTWCSGAPGIGLARLVSPGLAEVGTWRDDVEAALSTTLGRSLEGVDHACCGNLGVIELPIEAALRLHRPELLETARLQGRWIVNRALRLGGYVLFPDLRDIDFPNFFQGTSGIGYQLLRLARPKEMPSVLTWE